VSEESTTHDREELVRRSIEAFDRRDWDAAIAFFTPDGIWDSPQGLGVSAGRDAVRSLFQDRRAAFEHFEQDLEEFCDPGNGVTFCVVLQRGQPRGSSGMVALRIAMVFTWRDGLVERVTVYTDIDEARAAAERLSQERAKADV
jgi:ketosteroid isomerase-like protein